MHHSLGEGTLAKYHDEYIWPMFEKQRGKQGGLKKFGDFIRWLRYKYPTELDLRNLLGIKEGRVVDIPSLAAEYSTKNPLPPDRVWAGTHKKLWWKCKKCGYEWQALVCNRALLRRGCPACANRVVTEKNNLANIRPELVKEYSQKNPLPPERVVAGTHKRLWWQCAKCGFEWETSAHMRAQGRGCPSCVNKVVTEKNNLVITHPELAKEYSDKNVLSSSRVIAGTAEKLWWQCRKCGYEWQAAGFSRAAGVGCPACTNQVATETNNLTVTHPELTKEYSKRNELPASKVLAGTHKKLWWKCKKCGYEWQAGGYSRVRGNGCPACAGRVPTPTRNLAVTHPELAKEYSKRNRLPASQVLAGTGEKLWWKCRKCSHEWQSTGSNRVIGNGCPACANRVLTAQNNLAALYPELLSEYSEKNPLPADKVSASRQKLWWKCQKCGHEWQAFGYNRARGIGCPACSRNIVSRSNNLAATHPKLAKEYSQRNEFPVNEVIAGTSKKLWWRCTKCKYERQATGASRVQGHGCPACSRLVVGPLNNLAVTHPHLAKEYSRKNAFPADRVAATTSKKLWWKCKKCGYEWHATGQNRIHGTGCPACSNRVVTGKNNLAVTHPELAKEYSRRNRLSARQIVAGTTIKLWWRCRLCGNEWSATGASRVVKNTGCPACARRGATPTRNLATTHPELAVEYSKKNRLAISAILAGTNKTLWWKCGKCKYEWQASGASRLHGSGCPACRKRRKGKVYSKQAA